MKIKSVLFVACALGAMIVPSMAATVTLARGIGNVGIIAQESTGTALSAGGYYIAVGTFTNSSGATEVPVITTEFSSLLEAVAAFDVFGAGTAPTSGTTLGTLSTVITASGAPDPTVFQTKQLFVLVGNAATKALSTQWGIFSMTTPVFFPADVAAANSTTVTTSTFAAIAPLQNAGTAIDNASGADGFRLVAAIPEPSAALLGAIGALGLLRRRRN